MCLVAPLALELAVVGVVPCESPLKHNSHILLPLISTLISFQIPLFQLAVSRAVHVILQVEAVRFVSSQLVAYRVAVLVRELAVVVQLLFVQL